MLESIGSPGNGVEGGGGPCLASTKTVENKKINVTNLKNNLFISRKSK